MTMSDRIRSQEHLLHVLADTQSDDIFSSIISYCSKELILCIAEIFYNLSNLRVSLSDQDSQYLENNICAVEKLASIREDHPSGRRLIKNNIDLVKGGISIILENENFVRRE